MSDSIPNQIWFMIFQKLRARDLIRSSAVCKSWNCIIVDRVFIADHLKRVHSPQDEKIVFRSYVDDGRKIGVYSLAGDNSCDDRLKFDRSTTLQNVQIVGTSSGLVCVLLVLANRAADRLVIWNPYIRKAVSVSCVHRALQRRTIYAFFVHPNTQQYKIVCFPCKIYINDAPHKVEIYRQDLGVWNVIDSAVPCLITSSSATVNGVVHWLLTGTDGRNSISLFNMHTEACSEMSVPPSLLRKTFTFLSIGFSWNSLVLFESFPWGNGGAFDSSYSVIWVLKDSQSWSKQYRIEIYEMLLRPLGVRMSGEVLLTATSGDRLLCYDDVKDRITTTFRIEGIARWPAYEYVESLLLMDVKGASENNAFGEFYSDN